MHTPRPPQGPPASRSPLSHLAHPGAVVGGRYRLRAPLGAGAMGEVWLADHISLGTAVAVKLVDTTNRADAGELLARFELEARAAAQLKSPHVVQILDHGADGPVAFMAMELLLGESLEQRLERRGRLLPSEVAHVLREMARGVDRAHAAGVVHRDLKPPNVFVARVDGVEVVKVLDFGIAKILGASREAHLQTQAGFVIGTPAYMSPEQVLGKPIDHRSDLWQMAMVAFECTTGRRPFDGETLGQLFMAICNGPMPVPSAVATVPGAFDAWFARAASRDPAGRFASAGEMAQALGAIVAPGGVGESAIPTLVGGPRPDMAAPAATGRSEASHDGAASGPKPRPPSEAWSTGRVDPAPRIKPVAFIAGMALAPIAVLVLGGVWWLSTRHAVVEPVANRAQAAGVSSPRAAAAPLPSMVLAPPDADPPAALPVPSASASASAGKAAGRPPVPVTMGAPLGAAPSSAPKPPVTNHSPRTPGAKAPVDLGI